jgi:hypothetical protein
MPWHETEKSMLVYPCESCVFMSYEALTSEGCKRFVCKSRKMMDMLGLSGVESVSTDPSYDCELVAFTAKRLYGLDIDPGDTLNSSGMTIFHKDRSAG